MPNERNSDLWGWIAGGLLLLFGIPAAAMASKGVPLNALTGTSSKGPSVRAAIEAMAQKWGPVFGVPVETVMAIAQIESAYRMGSVNYSVRAMPLGGAWGPYQMTQTTANDWAGRLAKSSNAAARAVASRWKGDGRSLTTDLELASVLSIAMLGALTKEFGDFALVAAAYHQGAGKIRKMLAAGESIPGELPPNGKTYVAMALKARSSIA